MSFLSVVLWLLTTLSIVPSESFVNVNCISVTLADYATTESCGRVSCPTNYIMTGCGWSSPWRATSESYIDPATDECVMCTQWKGKPWAQCCDIGSFITCDTVNGSASASELSTIAYCSIASKVIGCVSHGENYVPTDDNITITNQSCIAWRQYTDGANPFSMQAICCDENSLTTIECKQITSDVSAIADDAEASISCKQTLGTDWFLTSCGEFDTSSTSAPMLDGHYYDTTTNPSDTCFARNSGSYNGAPIRAIAQCCRLNAPTSAPSSAPSSSPTAAPSFAPSESFVNVNCITITLANWGSGEQRVSCPNNYIMTGCGFDEPWKNVYEVYIDQDTGECVRLSGSGGKPYAQCCDIGSFITCDTVNGSASASELSTIAYCSSTSKVIGCVSHGENYVPTDDNIVITNQSCKAWRQFTDGANPFSMQAICCDENSLTTIECKQITGDASHAWDDALSSISCKETLGTDWFLTSCGELSTSNSSTPQIDGHYYDSTSNPSDTCVARNSGSSTVHSVAQCCRLSAPTSAPSSAPSSTPTAAPSLSPTAAPSSIPSSSPTIAPSLAPSANPTNAPSLAPTIAPSLTPTTSPSSAPSSSPTATPSLTPTAAPSLAPSSAPSIAPSLTPSSTPALSPTTMTTFNPTFDPSADPTFDPTVKPTINPTHVPTLLPTIEPTIDPTKDPTNAPTPICGGAKYKERMSYSQENNLNDFLWGGESLIAHNCEYMLRMNANGELSIYGLFDDLWFKGWSTNTSIYNRSGESVTKLVFINGGIQVMEYVYKSIRSILPIELWNSKDTGDKQKGSQNNELMLSLTDFPCLVLMKYGAVIDTNRALWFVCVTSFDTDNEPITSVSSTELFPDETHEGKYQKRRNKSSANMRILWILIIICGVVLLLFCVCYILKKVYDFNNDEWKSASTSSMPNMYNSVNFDDNEGDANDQETVDGINKWLWETAEDEIAIDETTSDKNKTKSLEVEMMRQMSD